MQGARVQMKSTSCIKKDFPRYLTHQMSGPRYTFWFVNDSLTTNSYSLQIIYLPGDNDIGGEGNDHVSRSKIQRFSQNFPSEVESYSGQIQFVIVNRIVGDFNLPSVSSKNDKFRVVLSHIPLTFVPGIFSREVI